MTVDAKVSIILFASPEVVQKELRNDLIIKFICNGELNLISIDKVCQFFNLGMSFRYLFRKLEEFIFNKITYGENVKLPVLFMTAIFNNLSLLTKIIGININKSNFIWSHARGFKKSNIDVGSYTLPQCIKHLKQSLEQVLSDNADKNILSVLARPWK